MQISKLTILCQSALQAISLHAAPLFMASVSISGLVLTPVAALAGVMGAWRLGADPGWTSDFFIADGLLSRYQLWFAVAISVQTSAFLLNRWVANQNMERAAVARRRHTTITLTELAHLPDVRARLSQPREGLDHPAI